jgi:DNA-binding MarR family transcriptional regulator
MYAMAHILNEEWKQLNAIGKAQAKKLNLKPSDVNRLIKEYRIQP